MKKAIKWVVGGVVLAAAAFVAWVAVEAAREKL